MPGTPCRDPDQPVLTQAVPLPTVTSCLQSQFDRVRSRAARVFGAIDTNSGGGIVPRLLSLALICGGLTIAVGCGGAERAAEEETGMEEEMGMEESQAGISVEMPDTTAAALWSYLQQADYRANWELWPGKGELYTGREPHGVMLTTYLNGPAYEALTGAAGTMPADAIIVKENYMADSTLAAVTVMYKVAGFNPEHGNWFWAKLGADGSVEVEGRGQNCIACHGSQSANDYIFTGSLGE